MMEYFFGGDNGYYQLPYFFKNFDKFLKVCHQYDSTVLMYLPDVPPYDLLRPLPNAPQLLLERIQSYFTGLGITFNTGGVDLNTYIQTKLDEYGPHIQAISEYLTKDFMVDISILDESISESQPSDSFQSTRSASSMSSTSSDAIGYFLLGPLEKDNSSQDPSWSQNSQYLGDSQSFQEMDSNKGGTLPIKYHIKKSITTRKNKNKNKPRTKSKTPSRRVTIRIKRLMKSKVTKPKTYKRRATGGKRKSKPNKTMRHYRRVRK